MLKMVTSSLQAERRAFDDILADSTDCLLAVSFGEIFHRLHQWVYRVRFFLENHDFFFVALIDDMVPIFHAFLDDNGHLTPMNSARYLSLLQNTVWSKLWYAATRSFLCWMQDGTPTKCINAVLAFLNEKFRGWVLSWRTANPRSAHITDFNLPDFYFWADMQNHDFQVKT